MPHLKRKVITLIAVFGLLALSGLAMAQPEHQEADTVFNFGYDEDGQVLVFGTADIEDEEECTLENGEVTVTYGEAEDGLIAVENGGEECELSGVEVTGPNGQVNHGMFMKAFNSIYKDALPNGGGRGCLIRHLAQSPELGKGDQQVRVPDAEPVVLVSPADIEFSTVTSKCQHGNGNAMGLTASEGRGKPDSPGKSGQVSSSSQQGKPESPGKSGSAPGRNK